MMIIMLTTITTTIFLFLKHPLSLGLTLLLQTLLIAMITGMMSLNFWYSYILLLIMVGGMLILFIYMTSVASNEKFKTSSKLMIMSIIILMILMSMMLTDNFFMNLNMFNDLLTNNIKNNNWSMSKYISYPTNKIMILMISYLLISLIMVVKITKISYGPLRQKF